MTTEGQNGNGHQKKRAAKEDLKRCGDGWWKTKGMHGMGWKSWGEAARAAADRKTQKEMSMCSALCPTIGGEKGRLLRKPYQYSGSTNRYL